VPAATVPPPHRSLTVCRISKHIWMQEKNVVVVVVVVAAAAAVVFGLGFVVVMVVVTLVVQVTNCDCWNKM